jgi:hypothetical protein
MYEKQASGAPRTNDVHTMTSGAAPGGPLGGSSTHRPTTDAIAHGYPLQFLIALIKKPNPGSLS